MSRSCTEPCLYQVLKGTGFKAEVGSVHLKQLNILEEYSSVRNLFSILAQADLSDHIESQLLFGFYSSTCFAEVFEKLFNVKAMFLGLLSCKQTAESAAALLPGSSPSWQQLLLHSILHGTPILDLCRSSSRRCACRNTTASSTASTGRYSTITACAGGGLPGMGLAALWLGRNCTRLPASFYPCIYHQRE